MLLSRRANGLARAGMAVGLVLAGPRFLLAQPTPIPGPAESFAGVPAPAATLPPAQPPTVVSDAPVVTAPESGAADAAPAPDGQQKPCQPAADKKPEQPASPWAKVPPLAPLPRPGLFIIWPSRPGYYSMEDWLLDEYGQAPPPRPWPPVSADIYPFYMADFRYLEDPNNKQVDWLDCLKRIHCGDCWMLSFGGEERVRYMNEHNGYVRITGKENDYTLERTRLYADLWYQDKFRVYAEFIDAQIAGEDLPPLPIDRNHSDFLNLFADLKLAELGDNGVYFRIGRQELCYGSQRLVSPLDWANTRRTFQGIKGFWHSDKLDVDAFWVQPIIVSPNQFDSPDSGQGFAGFWTTYRPKKTQAIDLYYLYLDNTRPVAIGTPLAPGPVGGYRVDTFGIRYAGDCNHWLWDEEGMYQFGHWANQETSAGAWTVSGGYEFAEVPMTPQFWVAYDWASGNHNPTGSEHGTFNQLFPFGHYYFGYLDLVGRQNIEDFNMQLVFFPTTWITQGIQYHMFRLESAKDALYNSAGNAIRVDPTGRAGSNVGDELDVFTNFHLTFHQDILAGYSYLWQGNFLKATGPGIGNPQLVYVQWSFKW
jgi:hypothetical protein